MRSDVAIFGGSFNPPHIGHTMCITYALSQYVHHVMVLPAYNHRDKDNLIDFDHRYNMCKLAFDWLPGVYVKQTEKDIKSEGKMLDTLKHLQSIHTTLSFRLLVGKDIIDNSDGWHRWNEVIKIAPPLVIDRGVVTPTISSSQIRENLSIDNKRNGDIIHPKVSSYINKHGLYQK